jgi:hypothetical protein
MDDKHAVIAKQEIKNSFSVGPVELLSLTIFYPEIKLKGRPEVEKHLNAYYRQEADKFYRYSSGNLLSGAKAEYAGDIKNGFPFRPYDAMMTYSVELNEGCHLSAYYEQYTYTGGAHGNTVRHSDTWDLETGAEVRLKELFPENAPYRRLILEQILPVADRQMENNPYVYFNDYRELIVKYFNPQSFYLMPKALAVYYQLYEIAPYASGIVVFEIPYGNLGIQKPDCRR